MNSQDAPKFLRKIGKKNIFKPKKLFKAVYNHVVVVSKATEKTNKWPFQADSLQRNDFNSYSKYYKRVVNWQFSQAEQGICLFALCCMDGEECTISALCFR